MKSMFLGGSDGVLSEMGTEQARRVLRASLAVHSYGKSELGTAEFIVMLFCDRYVSIPLLNCVKIFSWS